MSLLRKGAFMRTYRKKTTGASSWEEVCRYAVKVVHKDDMQNKGITEEEVRHEEECWVNYATGISYAIAASR